MIFIADRSETLKQNYAVPVSPRKSKDVSTKWVKTPMLWTVGLPWQVFFGCGLSSLFCWREACGPYLKRSLTGGSSSEVRIIEYRWQRGTCKGLNGRERGDGRYLEFPDGINVEFVEWVNGILIDRLADHMPTLPSIETQITTSIQLSFRQWKRINPLQPVQIGI